VRTYVLIVNPVDYPSHPRGRDVTCARRNQGRRGKAAGGDDGDSDGGGDDDDGDGGAAAAAEPRGKRRKGKKRAAGGGGDDADVREVGGTDHVEALTFSSDED
jgi:hypothetical protein